MLWLQFNALPPYTQQSFVAFLHGQKMWHHFDACPSSLQLGLAHGGYYFENCQISSWSGWLLSLYFLPNHYWLQIVFQLDDGISLCLHYLFSSSLVCQINIFAALLSEISWPYRLYHQFKSFLFFLSFIIPALYTGIIAHLQQSLPISIPTHLPDQVSTTSRNWLVSLSGNQFQAFLSMNLIFMTLYLVLFIKLVRALREKTENPIKNQHQR